MKRFGQKRGAMSRQQSAARRRAAIEEQVSAHLRMFARDGSDEEDLQAWLMALWLARGDRDKAWYLYMEHDGCAELAKLRAPAPGTCDPCRCCGCCSRGDQS